MKFRTPHATRRTAGVVLAALSVLAIVVATLRAAGDTIPDGWTLSIASGDEAAAEIIQNLLLFVPFGVALALLGKRWRFVLLSGIALSFTVEFLQQWIPGRDPSLGDIVMNGTSALLGGAIVWTAPRWLHPPDRLAPWLSLGTAAVAALIWLVTGVLFQPALPHTPYFDRWTPDIPRWPNYEGEIEFATLGPTVLEHGPIGGGERGGGSALGYTQLSSGATVLVHGTAGPPPDGRAPLLVINDIARRDVYIMGIDRDDLLLVYRTRAAAFTLARPDLRLRHALAGVAPGDTFTVSTRREARGRYCLNKSCGHGYTIGDAWQLIFFPEHFRPWASGLLDAIWVGGTLLSLGFLGRRHPASGAALLLAVAALAAAPALTGLRPTPVTEWVGAIAGCVIGHLAWRWRNTLSSLRAPPF